MSIKVGDKLPDATLHVMSGDGPKAVTVAELFDGKKVVLFALPGAFTPTCSKRHLPGFIDQADALRANGVDSILCLSVNDAFVMQAWGLQQGADDHVMMIADGNGDFTRAVGLELDGSGAGLGQRSQRYAMIVDDRVVSHLAVEQPKAFQVSTAEAILEVLQTR